LGKNQTQLMLPRKENWLVGTNSVTMLGVLIDQKLDRLSENRGIAMRKIGFLWSFALSIYMYTV
jgi:hypothetical protein